MRIDFVFDVIEVFGITAVGKDGDTLFLKGAKAVNGFGTTVGASALFLFPQSLFAFRILYTGGARDV